MGAFRHDNGRFALGNRGGPGRPSRAVEAQYLTALRESVPRETWGKICETAVAQALDGDAMAREWISAYLIGKPLLMAVEVSAPSGPKLSLGMILMAIREAIPDGDAQARIADALLRLAREATGDDGSSGDQLGVQGQAGGHPGPSRYPLAIGPR
jgi:hypothetical protein